MFIVSLPPIIRALLTRIEERGFHARIIGGAIRDTLMGTPPDDWDFLTDAPQEILAQLFPARKINTERHIMRFTENTFLCEINFALQPEIFSVPTAMSDYLMERDFPCNTVMCDARGLVYDPLGGEQDIKNHYLRPINIENFFLDPTRLLRLVRMLAKGLNITYPWFIQLAQQQASELWKVPPAILRAELSKIFLASKNCSLSIPFFYSMGFFSTLFPQAAMAYATNPSTFIDHIRTIATQKVSWSEQMHQLYDFMLHYEEDPPNTRFYHTFMAPYAAPISIPPAPEISLPTRHENEAASSSAASSTAEQLTQDEPAAKLHSPDSPPASTPHAIYRIEVPEQPTLPPSLGKAATRRDSENEELRQVIPHTPKKPSPKKLAREERALKREIKRLDRQTQAQQIPPKANTHRKPFNEEQPRRPPPPPPSTTTVSNLEITKNVSTPASTQFSHHDAEAAKAKEAFLEWYRDERASKRLFQEILSFSLLASADLSVRKIIAKHIAHQISSFYKAREEHFLLVSSVIFCILMQPYDIKQLNLALRFQLAQYAKESNQTFLSICIARHSIEAKFLIAQLATLPLTPAEKKEVLRTQKNTLYTHFKKWETLRAKFWRYWEAIGAFVIFIISAYIFLKAPLLKTTLVSLAITTFVTFFVPHSLGALPIFSWCFPETAATTNPKQLLDLKALTTTPRGVPPHFGGLLGRERVNPRTREALSESFQPTP